MKNYRVFLIAALLGTVLVGCQKEKEIERPDDQPTTDKTTVTLTVQVSKETDDTRALAIDGKKLKATWAENEKVDVYLGETRIGTLTVTATANAGATATLSGTVTKTDDLKKDCTLTLLFPGRDDHAWTYLGQDGSFLSGTLAQNYDYTLATLNVDEDVTGDEVSVTVSGNFSSQQSVYRFGFKVNGAGNAVAVKSFTVSSNQNKLVRARTNEGGIWTSNYGPLLVTTGDAPDDNLYCVAIRNDNTSANDTYTFDVVGTNDALYEGTLNIGSNNLGNGKFLGAKGISITQKAFAPEASGTISSVNAVL